MTIFHSPFLSKASPWPQGWKGKFGEYCWKTYKHFQHFESTSSPQQVNVNSNDEDLAFEGAGNWFKGILIVSNFPCFFTYWFHCHMYLYPKPEWFKLHIMGVLWLMRGTSAANKSPRVERESGRPWKCHHYDNNNYVITMVVVTIMTIDQCSMIIIML